MNYGAGNPISLLEDKPSDTGSSIARPFGSLAAIFFGSQLNKKSRPSSKRFSEAAQIESAEASSFRSSMEACLGATFVGLAKRFKEDGLLILDGFFSADLISEMRRYYIEQQTSVGKANKLLNLEIFSGSATQGVTLPDSTPKVVNPLLLSMMSFHCGSAMRLADFRGYTSNPDEPMSIRAWGWHTDGVIATKAAPEIKVMILLKDIETTEGQPMFYIKGSQRPWIVSSQRDANFLPGEVSEVLGYNPRITVCGGKAGTVILFDGEGIHCATRGQLTREVVVMTFRPNNNPAIFPIPPLKPELAGSISDSFIGTALGAEGAKVDNPSAQMLAQLDQHKPAILKATAFLRETSNDWTMTTEKSTEIFEKHKEYRTINSMKPRTLVKDSRFETREDMLLAIARIDLHADLDLLANPGNQDILRDTLRIQIRETGDSDLAVIRLQERFKTTKDDLDSIRIIPDFQEAALFFVDYLERHAVSTGAASASEAQLSGSFNNKEGARFRAACSLAIDLKEALSHCEFVQELRSNILFLYFLYDEAFRTFKDPILNNKAQELISAYTSVMHMDDSLYLQIAKDEREESIVGYGR